MSVFDSKLLKDIKPYNVSDSAKLDYKEKLNYLKLDWNETTIKTSDKVIKSVTDFILSGQLNYYPDVLAKDLKTSLRKYTDNKNVEVFNGSDSALKYIFDVFLDSGDKVLVTEPTYTQIVPFIKINGGFVESYVPSNIFDIDMKEFEQHCNDKKIIYIVNPNNPTGYQYNYSDVEKLVKKFNNTLFVIDEAYHEFAGSTLVDLTKDYDNVVVTRTFSKAFGLAGIRLGYVVSDEKNIDSINKIRNSKEVNTIAQLAGVTALNDINYMLDYVEEVNEAKLYFSSELDKMNYDYEIGNANFMLVKVKNPKSFITHLKNNKILIRDRSFLVGLKGYVRFTIGTIEDMKKVIGVIKSYE